jgi:hypothetical protein
MPRKQVKTQGFVRKKKYRDVRAALHSADQFWIPIAEKSGADVKIQKRDGKWTVCVSRAGV